MKTSTSPNLLHHHRARSFRRWPKLFALAASLAFTLLNSSAATVPAGFVEATVASGLSGPTAMEFAPDGRLFVCQQSGQLRVIKNGALLPAPFLTVTADYNGERGLLGIAFDPNFAVNQFVYVYYTATSPTVHNRVSRFTASGDIVVPGSEVVILELNNLSGASNHNGGAIHFGSDGKLYIVAGENANSANSQTLANLLGKMLRINADGTIPIDNPFYNTASGANRAIWAMGLRNPFTFAIQPGTGRIFINDVGESTWEEINEAVPGANYGWPNCEGYCSPANPSYRDPTFRYAHSAGQAIAGGAFYNPATVQFPATQVGLYFFADFTAGWIQKLDPANGNQVTGFATGINGPVDLKVGADGRLYYLSRGSGAVRAISYTGGGAPQISQQPVDQTVQAGQAATFTVASTGTLGHRWQRNATNITGATGSSYTLASALTADDGAAFRCVLTNFSGAVTSSAAILRVSSNNPPSGIIAAPINGTLYTAGDTISFNGRATDPESGNLPASAFSWTIMFHHDTHSHPFLGPLNGVTNGSFTIPTQGETAANVWYRISLTVTDSGGRSHTNFSDVRPRISRMTLATLPAGLQVTLDGQPFTTPVLVTNVVGMSRTVGAVSPQTFGGSNYGFASWSDGGSATHGISSPATDTTYTAAYQAVTVVTPSNSVPQWGRFETAFTNTIPHADQYRDVTLNVFYTRPDGSTVSFWGFHDGGTTWRIRFMPDQLGTWSFTASFTDGAPGRIGSFECVPGNIPGMITKDETNPMWFGYKGGGHGVLRSFHVGDRYFATNWASASRTAFLDWAQSQGYNMLSVPSHYLNRNVSGRGQGWNTPDLWDGPARALKAAEYQKMETLLDDLAARKMAVFPFAGFFGKSSDFPLNQADQELYIRYTLARIGPYWNIVLAVAGPEPLLSTDTGDYRNAMGFSELARLGNLIKSLDVFGHPLTVHNVSDQNAFRNEPWESYSTLQGPKTTIRTTLSSGLLAAHGAKPLYAQELLWPGNTLGHPAYSTTDIRKNGFVMMMSAATINFGDMNGNSSSGFSGTMNLADRIQSRHDAIKGVWDIFETQNFYRMSPHQNLVNNGFCLAEPGREYLIYLQARGTVSVTLSNGPYQVTWINAQNTLDRRTATATGTGLNLASPSDGDDWLLHLSNGSPPGNTPPTISNIPDQFTTVNTPTLAIPFTINDGQTPAVDLTLDRSSSNPGLVPASNIVFGGSGGNRTVTVTPITGLTGSATITVSVSDGTNSASDTFVLTLTAVNTPPTITGLAAQTFAEDTSSGPMNFTIGDAETTAANLTLGKASSNPTLVPTNSIVFGGSGNTRTVTMTPAANQNGTAVITMSVSDGQFTVTTNFLLTISAVNDAPTITGIANQSFNVNGTAGPLSFTVADVETAAASLTLGKSSSNATLVPTNNIVFGGSGSSRSVTVTPAAGQTGTATIVVIVGDGQDNVSTSFVVTVSAALTGTKSFTNATVIAIPGQGSATPYPSAINVTGLSGMISNVTLTLRSLTHTWTRDIDVLLVSPSGQKVVLMSDAGSGGANNVTLTLSDAAGASLPTTSLTSGTYRPANYADASSGGDSFPGPAPADPYATALSALNAQPANGAWSLYVRDDGPGDLGSFAGGWILTLSTTGIPVAPIEPPAQILAVSFDLTRTMRVTASGQVGRSYALEASSDWINWIRVDVQANATGSVALSEQPTTNKSRYYRVVSVPR